MFEKKYAEVLIAEQDQGGNKTPVGMALVSRALSSNQLQLMALILTFALQYFYSFSTWTSKPSLYLEDLFVIPSLRNKGVGKLLFRELGKVAIKKQCGRMDWSVLDWNA